MVRAVHKPVRQVSLALGVRCVAVVPVRKLELDKRTRLRE